MTQPPYLPPPPEGRVLRYTLSRKLGELQRLFGYFAGKKTLLFLQGTEPRFLRRPARSPVVVKG